MTDDVELGWDVVPPTRRQRGCSRALVAVGALVIVAIGVLVAVELLRPPVNPSASDLPLPDDLVGHGYESCGSAGCATGSLVVDVERRGDGPSPRCSEIEDHLRSLGWRTDEDGDLVRPDGGLVAWCTGVSTAEVVLEWPGRVGFEPSR